MFLFLFSPTPAHTCPQTRTYPPSHPPIVPPDYSPTRLQSYPPTVPPKRSHPPTDPHPPTVPPAYSPTRPQSHPPTVPPAHTSSTPIHSHPSKVHIQYYIHTRPQPHARPQSHPPILVQPEVEQFPTHSSRLISCVLLESSEFRSFTCTSSTYSVYEASPICVTRPWLSILEPTNLNLFLKSIHCMSHCIAILFDKWQSNLFIFCS